MVTLLKSLFVVVHGTFNLFYFLCVNQNKCYPTNVNIRHLLTPSQKITHLLVTLFRVKMGETGGFVEVQL